MLPYYILGGKLTTISDLRAVWNLLGVRSWRIDYFEYNNDSPIPAGGGFLLSYKHNNPAWGSQAVIMNGEVYTRSVEYGDFKNWKQVTLT